jgi:hypothetical protein
MNIEHWSIDAKRGKPRETERNLFQYHFVSQKYHTGWLGIEPDFLSTG